jgi:hypothetical protein
MSVIIANCSTRLAMILRMCCCRAWDGAITSDHLYSGRKFCKPGYDYRKSKTAQRYRRMRDALNKQKRPILYSLCNWGTAGVASSWGIDTAESWRTTGDIGRKFKSFEFFPVLEPG